MLESMRRGQRWLTGIFIGVIGVVFAAFIGLGGPLTRQGSASSVVELDDRHFGLLDFERIRQQQEDRYREALGDQFDPKAAREFLDAQALRTLVDSAVLAQAAEELGFRVSKEEIQRTVRAIPGFRDESGRFDQEGFIELVEYQYGSQRNFLRVLTEDLLKQKLGRLLSGQASVSEAEARRAALYQLDRVSIAYVALDTTSLPAGESVSDEQAEAYLEEHRDALRALYDDRLADYALPERVRARHILVQVPEDASEDAVAVARQRAEQARTRIAEGASFADVAMEVSEDPGTREKGGDLGLVARGEISGALEDAVFGQEVGVLGEVIRSDSGFHVVLVEAREPAGHRPFEEVALELAREQAAAGEAARRARATAETLSNAVSGGASLEEAARAEGLTLERPDPLRRRPDGFVPGLGASPELLAVAFELPADAPSSPRIFEVGPKLVLIQVLDHPPVDEAELARTTEELRQQLLEFERTTLLQNWIDARRAQLLASDRLRVYSDLVMNR